MHEFLRVLGNTRISEVEEALFLPRGELHRVISGFRSIKVVPPVLMNCEVSNEHFYMPKDELFIHCQAGSQETEVIAYQALDSERMLLTNWLRPELPEKSPDSPDSVLFVTTFQKTARGSLLFSSVQAIEKNGEIIIPRRRSLTTMSNQTGSELFEDFCHQLSVAKLVYHWGHSGEPIEGLELNVLKAIPFN